MRPSPLSNLDVLRSIAVLLVLFDHVAAEAFGMRDGIVAPHELGKAGVLLFFLHSSFVLMQSLNRGGGAALPFYTRRAFRIYPLALVAIGSALFLHLPAMPTAAYRWVGWKYLAANILLVTNFPNCPLVLLPLWSLAWEVQMYALLPLISRVALRPRGMAILWFLWAAAITMVAVAFRLHVTPLRLFEYAPCFLSGALALKYFPRRKPILSPVLWPLLIFISLAIYRPLWAREQELHSVIGAYLLCIAAGLAFPLFRPLSEGALATVARIVARYSYGVYLFQVPIVWFAFIRLQGTVSMPMRWAVFGAGMVVVPFVGYHAVEKPMISLGAKLASRIASPRPRVGTAQQTVVLCRCNRTGDRQAEVPHT
jgi:peptidoglycan/LPS O-acetylase OafA/YrhL